MFKVVIASRAAKKIKTFPKQYQDSVREILKELEEDPSRGKPLNRKLINKYSIPISKYRIIYQVNFEKKRVSVINADDRETVYS